jgi:perosamine synthetase
LKFENKFISLVQEIYKTTEFIPLHEPKFIGNEKKYVLDTIDSTFVSSVGKYVDDFEKKIADFVGVKFSIATVNGTSALQIAMQISDVNPGDLVITQSLTFVATCNAIKYCGAEPLFVDVDKSTMGLSPASLEDYLDKNAIVKDSMCIHKDSGKVIKACVPMHTFGCPSSIIKIKRICTAHHIKLVEDSAESLGSTFDGQHTGTFGDVGIISFNGNKIITTGGGGMILTNNEELALKAKHITTTAKIPHKWDYVHDMIGFNYRMPNLNAALGCAQIESLPTFVKSKRKLAELYANWCSENDVTFFQESGLSKSNYWLNALILKDSEQRIAFLKATNENGVMTRPSWKPMHKLEMFADCYSGSLANTDWLSERIVNIPSSVTG